MEGSVIKDESEGRTTGNTQYGSYLLRWWQEGPGSGERLLLQDVLGGEPRCFASLESLFAYLDAARGQLEGRDDSQIGVDGRQPMNRETGRAT